MIDGFQSRHGSSDAAVILSPLSAEESVEINAAQRKKKTDVDPSSVLSHISTDKTGQR